MGRRYALKRAFAQRLLVIGLVATLATTWLTVRCLYSACVVVDAASPPAAVLERTRWDFGAIEAGPIRSARFPVRNHGGHRLLIAQVHVSCECLVSRRIVLRLEPGESSEIELQMHTAELRSGVALEAHYTTNDPNLPRFTLAVLAEVGDEGVMMSE